MQGTLKAQQIHRSGDEVPDSGVYTVLHDGHRENHSATILRAERFPACAQCGSRVRFALVRAATPITDDSDFQQISAPPSTQL